MDTYPTLLQTISDQHLSGTLAVLLSNGIESRVVGLLVADKRTVCLDDNLVFRAVFDNVTLLVPRMKLLGRSPCQMVHLELD